MKKSFKFIFTLTAVLCFVQFFAAAKGGSVDVWVSGEANGKEIVTGSGDQWIGFDSTVDAADYKYFIVEASSPDIKNLNLCMYIFSPEYEKDKRWTLGTLRVKGLTKKLTKYQCLVTGNASNPFDSNWVNDKPQVSKVGDTKLEGCWVCVNDANWKEINGIKIYIKKITATNTPLGKEYVVDLNANEKNFIGLQGQRWGNPDKNGIVPVRNYGCNFDILGMLAKAPAAGDVICVKFKGVASQDIKNIVMAVVDDSDGWVVLGEAFYDSASKDKKFSVEAYFVLTSTPKKLRFNIETYDAPKPTLITLE